MLDLRELKQEWKYRSVSAVAWAGVSLLAPTVKLQVVGGEEARQRQDEGLPCIVVTWHGRTLLPIWRYGPRKWVAIISNSRDGEYQARIFRRFGWDMVRGSTGRGGIRALASGVRRLREGATLAFTPDGPRGPSHFIHPGVLFLSQKAGCPIYPMGVSAYPRWMLSTWDRYQVPRPFSRAAIVYGEPSTVPADASENDLISLAADLAARICAAETEAEAIAAPVSGRIPCVPYSAP
ncbi:MAG: lysophospholipid acyltransferase family protein, partial [Chloroflexi bacterium]|nr:lysophospholipid acyltransferase family protein [Chloroflexota bacterium]